ncbi:MAG TPA: HAD hydrolase-like protein [Acidimicrobiales bacterium]|nr:HAD hydrolase-like protein [Acidimicrobiales bacterium]
MGYTTVLFDLDGTLTDSKAGIVESYRHTLASYGIEADETSVSPWIGPPLAAGFAAFGLPGEEVPRAIDRYRAHFGDVGIHINRLYDGVADLLTELVNAGITLGLATSKLSRFADQIVARFGIAEHFRFVAGANEDGSRVTKEDIVGFALERLDRPDPGTTAMVGDRSDDMRAAVRHGLFGVGAAWGYGGEEELTAAGSRVLVAAPSDLASLILAPD